MQRNKPPPPPGRPTIAQRVSAIQLASRAHSLPKEKMVARGQGLVLPAGRKQPRDSPIPSTIVLPSHIEEIDEDRICKKSRLRFIRSKSKDIYPRKDNNMK